MPDVVPVPQVGDPITARWGGSVANAINSNTPQVGNGQTPAGRVGDPPPPDFSSRARAIPYGITLTPNGDATDDSPGTLTLLIHEPSMAYSGVYNPYNFLSANRPRGGQYVVVADDIPADFSGGLELFLRVRYNDGVSWFVARTGGSSYAKVVGLTGDVDTCDESILLFSSRISGTDRDYVPQVSAPILMPRPASNPDSEELYHVASSSPESAETPLIYYNSIQRNALDSRLRIATDESSVSVSVTTNVGSLSLAGFYDGFVQPIEVLHGIGSTFGEDFEGEIGQGKDTFGLAAVPYVQIENRGTEATPASRRHLSYFSLFSLCRFLRDKILQWAHDYTDDKISDLEDRLNASIDAEVQALNKRIDDLSSGS